MKKVGATSLFVKRRDENDEFGITGALLRRREERSSGQEPGAPERVSVYEVMAKPVLCPCGRIWRSAIAPACFDNFGISHAPVVKDGEILGLVSYYLLVLEGLDLD